jgi:pimeloyl-ACP methyl ester carboxylesterase
VLVGNDSGGAICQILTADDPDVVDRLVLTPADAFEHFPPTLFRPLPLIARSPRLLGAAVWPLTRRRMRRMPGGLGWLSKRPIPDALIDDWSTALYAGPAMMRDMAGFVAPMRPRLTLDAAEQLRTFPRPALMAWATEDRFFPFSDGEKLAALIPQGRIVPIHDSYTFTPIDQPDATAEAIVSFLRDTEQAAQPPTPTTRSGSGSRAET